tara:strand:- start:1225 stop:2031 length:807 start_codon:yes stop_codon:yes gene_type:complete
MPPDDDKRPRIITSHRFPGGDIPDNDAFHSVQEWLSKYDTLPDNDIRAKLQIFSTNKERIWRNKASDEAIATYEAAHAVIMKWSGDTASATGIMTNGTPSFKLARVIADHLKIFPVHYPDFTDTFREMKQTFVDYSNFMQKNPDLSEKELATACIDPDTKRSNRALLFGRQAWQSMRQHGRVYESFSHLHTIIARGYRLHHPVQHDIARAGMGLVYMMGVHSHLQQTLTTATGIKIPQPGQVQATDSEILYHGNFYAEPPANQNRPPE